MRGKLYSSPLANASEELVGDYHRYYSSRSAGYYRGVEIVLGEVEGETGSLARSSMLSKKSIIVRE